VCVERRNGTPFAGWNTGETALTVASRFIAENGLGLEHTMDIVNFVDQANQSLGLPAASAASVGSSVPAPARAAPSSEVRARLMQQVTEMGFDAAQAQAALDATGWVSAEAALDRLLA
jgi:hypothetical protein